MNNIEITESINSIERSHKQHIEDFFLSVYPNNHLISHGLEHHRRVWAYAKEVIMNSTISKEISNNNFLSNIFLACYFHDIGMSIDPGIRHGWLGRKLCTEFLNSSSFIIAEFKDAIEAIEYHDDKNYLAHPEDNKVLDFLSVADDLDAFGITGIYRYSEIYLKRGISFQDIGWMIIKNAESRFANLENRIGLSPEFILKHKARYNDLINFFNEFNTKVISYNFSSHSPSGHCGIIQILAKNDVNIYSKFYEKYSKDPFISWFFEGLSSELDPVRSEQGVIPPGN
jgi:hypothetical protein